MKVDKDILIAGYLEGRLSSEQFRQLDSELRGNPAVRTELLRSASQEAELQSIFRLDMLPQPGPEQAEPEQQVGHPAESAAQATHIRPSYVSVAVATTLVVACILAWLFNRGKETGVAPGIPDSRSGVQTRTTDIHGARQLSPHVEGVIVQSRGDVAIVGDGYSIRGRAGMIVRRGEKIVVGDASMASFLYSEDTNGPGRTHMRIPERTEVTFSQGMVMRRLEGGASLSTSSNTPPSSDDLHFIWVQERMLRVPRPSANK